MNDVNKVSRKLEHFFEEMGEKAQATRWEAPAG